MGSESNEGSTFFPNAVETSNDDHLHHSSSVVFIIKKTLILLTAYVAILFCGSVYLFSTYSLQLLKRLALSSNYSSLWSSFSTVGLFLGGPMAGYFSDNFRPVMPLSLATLLSSASYFLLAYTIANPSKWLLSIVPLYYTLIGLSSCLAYNCALSTIVRLAPKTHRGWMTTVGCTFFALSSLWLTKVKAMWFSEENMLEGFFLFLGTGVGFANLLFGVTSLCLSFEEIHSSSAAPFSPQEMSAAVESERRIDCSGVELPSDLVNNGSSRTAHSASPCHSPFGVHHLPVLDNSSSTNFFSSFVANIKTRFGNRLYLFLCAVFSLNVAFSITYIFKHPEIFLQMTRSHGSKQPSGSGFLRANLVQGIETSIMKKSFFEGNGFPWVSFLEKAGHGFAGNNHSYPDTLPSKILEHHSYLNSGSNLISRLVVGLLSDRMLISFSVPRFTFLIIASAMAFVGWGVLLIYGLEFLPSLMQPQILTTWPFSISTVLLGACYGITFSITPIIVSEWFGTKNFGSNWGWMGFFPTIGHHTVTFIFASLLEWSKKETAAGPSGGLPTGLVVLLSFGCGSMLLLSIATSWFIFRRKQHEIAPDLK